MSESLFTVLDTQHNQPAFTVSELSSAVKRTVEDAFGYVRVRGEISGFKPAPSGHLYFSLKDEQAVMAAICWKGTSLRLNCKPEDGLEVICTGKLTTYPGQSKYQLIVEQMEPAGMGALMALLEKRKKQLAAEGLFDSARKKPLPFLPRTIGIITSPTGAVIRDILHRLKDRFPVHVLLWPVLVQGDQAAGQIASAIAGFNALPEGENTPRPDILIVARGGGSLEDLWAFNEEIVVRAVAHSHIPLISAVGHETDTTLIDYASDVRAPTPTAAAEMAVPVRTELLASTQDRSSRLTHALHRTLHERELQLKGLSRALPSPSSLMDYAAQTLDNLVIRLQQSLPRLLDNRLQIFSGAHYGQRMLQAFLHKLRYHEQQLSNLSGLLNSYHYQKVLERGFALVRHRGSIVHTAKEIEPGMAITIEFHDGATQAVAGGNNPPSPAAKKKKSPPVSSSQHSLL